MSPIPDDKLHRTIVNVTSIATVGEAAWGLQNKAAGGDPATWYVVVRMSEGRFAVLTAYDLNGLLESHGLDALGQSLQDIEGLLVPSKSVEQDEVGMTAARYFRDLSHRQILVVLKNGVPLGTLTSLEKAVTDGEPRALFGQGLLPPQPDVLRWIQGQLYELRAGKSPQRVERVLRAGTPHIFAIRIGPADEDWLTPSAEATFPDRKLGWDLDAHELRIVLSEPNHIPEPLTATVKLPRTGPSSACEFRFETRTDVHTFRGRVIVLHRNRVLQTALLEATVVSDPGRDSVAEPLRLDVIEGLIRPDLAGLQKARQDFGLALVVNHTPDDVPAVTAVSADLVAFRPLGDLDDKRRTIVELLSDLAETPDDYPKDLRHKNNTELLWNLAFLGSALYAGIVPSQISSDRLKKLPYIQLVSASHDYLPLEFFYELPAPKVGAKPCPKAEDALRDGECAQCAELDGPPGVGAEVICPLGFWCMRYVIERHAVRADRRSDLDGAPFGLRAAPAPGADELKVLGGALLAASDKVDTVRGGTTQQVLNTLHRVTDGHAHEVETWDAWLKGVKTHAPSLLVLLPHTSTIHLGKLDWPQLEIGHGQALVERYITPNTGQGSEYLLATPDASAPAVFLLGCETLDSDVGVGDFTLAFQDGGAAIVLSSLTPILGREAGPVAEMLVEHLWDTIKEGVAAEDKTFGYTLRALRRQMLADGNLVVLCLVAHGDADWHLAL